MRSKIGLQKANGSKNYLREGYVFNAAQEV